MIALLDRVERLRPRGRQLFGLSLDPSTSRRGEPVACTEPSRSEPSGRSSSTGPGYSRLCPDKRGATHVTYVLVLPLLILLVFGSFAVWRIIAIRQTLFHGTYKAARYLSMEGRFLDPDPDFDDDLDDWEDVARIILRTEVEGNQSIDCDSLSDSPLFPFLCDGPIKGNHLIDCDLISDCFNVTVTLPTLPIGLVCTPGPDDERLIDDILFTVEVTLILLPIHIPFLNLNSIDLTLTEQRTGFVECPRFWKGTPPPEKHIY